jgi:phospholipid/cholesterol/gamma-HCH transport system substrate-binding protein
MAGLLVLGATAQRGLPGADHYNLNADFANATNLGRYAEVRIAGRRVGQVLDVMPHHGIARVRLQLNPDVRPLRVGTTARIRLKGLLGAKFVELHPAAAGAPMPAGATLPTAATSSTVELFDVFQALDKRRRAALRTALRGLGAGFLGRGDDVNAALRSFPKALTGLGATARAITARSGAAARLFPSADAAAQAFEPARDDIAAGWAPQARALAPFADRHAAVRATLDAAPPALDALQAGLRQSDPLLVQAARLARAARQFTGPAPTALRQTAALLRDSRRPLQNARALLKATAQAVSPTLALTHRVDPLITPVVHALTDGLPIFGELDKRRCDFLGFVRNWRGMLAWGTPGDNPIGPIGGLRVTLVAGKGTAQQLVGDLPAATTHDVGHYPAYCGLGQVAPLAGGSR